MMRNHLLKAVFCIMLINLALTFPAALNQPEQNNLRKMTQLEQISLSYIQDKTIKILSSIINFLKRILVLATLLFLIQNLINFWVLASSYAFLEIQMPSYFKQTISNIYTLYNQSFFSYVGINIEFPIIRTYNQIYLNLPNSPNYQFDFFKFTLEPLILLALTLIELSIIKKIIQSIKNKAKQHRQQYVKKAIQIQLQKNNNIFEIKSKQIKKQEKTQNRVDKTILQHLYRNNKVGNDKQLNAEDYQPKKNNFFLQITERVVTYHMKKQIINKNYKHWSDDVNIDMMEKVSALLINYMPGLLIPAYSLLFNNRTQGFWQKLALLLYYILLCSLLIFPFLYISGISKKKKEKNKENILKNSDIQTLSQYSINLFMSISLGIRISPVPFLVTTFVILSCHLVYSFMEGRNQISCGNLSKKKINNIIHKLTFWLYHCVFIGIYLIMQIKKNSEGSFRQKINDYGQSCSIFCLWIFIVGGCHQLIQFAIKSVYFTFKLIYMVYQACSRQQYQDDANKEDDVSQLKLSSKVFKLKEKQHNIAHLQNILQPNNTNIFDHMRDGSEISQDQNLVEILAHQIRVHELLIQNLDDIQL